MGKGDCCDETNEVAAAQGLFVYVCVDKQSQRPTETPENFRSALQALVAGRSLGASVRKTT
jgi:acyl-CoA thioesterase FadM